MLKTKLGSLTVRITGGHDGRGGGDGPVVVLMHGFGAGGDDLVPLAPALRVPSSVRFAFPEAPHALPPSMGGYGRMWWALDAARLAAISSGVTRDMRGEDPPGLDEVRGVLVESLEALRRELSVPRGGFVLGGFSQGAILACDVAFRSDFELDGLVVLSGSTVAEEEWKAGMARRASLPVFQSHGTADPILPFSIAEQLSSSFDAAGLKRRWVPFRGGHEIPMPVLTELTSFLTPLVVA
jgi:phospholipase/carboxylesterase